MDNSTSQARQRGILALVAAIAVFAVLILPQVVEDEDGRTGLTGSGRTPTAMPGLPNLPNLPQPPSLPGLPTPGATTGGSGSSSGGWTDPTGGGSGGATGGGAVRTREPSAPTRAPDPTAEAFRAVRPGDCLAVYDTGHGEWSTRSPYRVGCGSGNATVFVTAVRSSAASCPGGAGQSYWSYTSGGSTTALCLNRQFQVGYCLLAEQSGSGSAARMNAGLMTAVDCDADKVPSKYNQILHITGVYRAPSQPSSTSCARAQGDQTYYWYWMVNGGRTLLCTMVYRG
ncbi:hypothetical protein LRS74_28865 [Streptomyces sp. LX-29]|uniref:LppU/SCO3897 family protein n=1 Tax=Streptomyces sp. LX-29 TaxID=2900152 RepID=UPI00240DB952|nr:hypothetical protein [Streptomyces sp. LX-29]WFB10598.1 hypothetical protein LRS74_28865 [Streptomyces sp. LX-29]